MINQPVQRRSSTPVPAPACGNVQEFEPRQVRLVKRPLTPADRSRTDSPAPLLAVPVGPLAEEEREEIQRQAFQQGFEEGERAGAERATAEYREAVAAFGRSAWQVATLKARLRGEAERELVELAFAIARRIMRRELAVDPTAVAGLVRACLEQFSRAEISRLRVNPQDFALLVEFFQQQTEPRPEVIADPKIGRGGAVFETARGVLDARVEAQLEEIERGLADI